MSESRNTFKSGNAPISLSKQNGDLIGLEFADVTTVTAQTPSSGSLPPPTPGGDILQRDVFIGRVTIASSDAPNDKVISDMDPVDLWLQNPLVQSRVRGYKWLHGDFVLTAVTTAPGGCYGAYNVQAICEGGVTGAKAVHSIDSSQSDSFATSLQDVYGVINCASLNSVQLHLPLFSLTDAISVVPGDTPPSWRIIMWPLAPIQSTSAPSATGSVSVYVRMLPGFVLEGRTMQSNPDTRIELNPSAGPTLSESIRSLLPTLEPARPVLEPIQNPVRKVGNMAAGLIAATASSILASVKSVASHVLLDTTPPVGAVFTDGEFGSLFSRWTVVRRVTISATTPLGHVCSIPVSPFLPYTHGGVDYHTPGGYVGLPFTYWRGSVEFMIYIPSHESIHGGLQIFWDPDSTSEYSEDPTNWLEGTSASLSGTSAKKVRVGMGAQVPTRLCHVYRPGENANSSGANGFLVLYLTSQMSCPRPGASLTILILSRSGDDMRFSVPRHITRVGEGRFRPIGEAYRLQAGEIDLAADATSDSILQEGGAPLRGMRASSNISAFLRAKSWAGQVRIARFPTEEGSNCFFVRSFPLAPASSRHGPCENHVPSGRTSRPPWTWGGYYGAMFVGLRGTTKVTLVARGASLQRVAISLCASEECGRFGVAEGSDVTNNFYGFVSSPGMYGGMVLSLPENEPVVVTLPSDDPRPFHHARVTRAYPAPFPKGEESIIYTAPYLRILIGASRPSDITPVWIDYYIAGGDDFEGVRFRRIPGVIVEDVVREES